MPGSPADDGEASTGPDKLGSSDLRRAVGAAKPLAYILMLSSRWSRSCVHVSPAASFVLGRDDDVELQSSATDPSPRSTPG